jgi:hypothetical protein
LADISTDAVNAPATVLAGRGGAVIDVLITECARVAGEALALEPLILVDARRAI